MNLTNHFSLHRLGLLLKMEFFRNRKGILMTLVVLFGFMLVGFTLSLIFEPHIKTYDDHPQSYAFSLLIGGFILSSLAFNDLGSTLRRYHYLTLPASTLEKFLSMWLLTAAGWVILFSAVFFIYAWILNGVGSLLFRNVTFLAPDLFGSTPVLAIKFYVVLQGVFLVGAAHFKAYVFPKTLFTLVVFAIVCATIAYFIISDLFMIDEDTLSGPAALKGMAAHRLWVAVEGLFWWTLAPLCWIVAYLGLKEKEA